MCSVWMAKFSAIISLDVIVLHMDCQVLRYQLVCQCALYGSPSALLSVWIPISSVWIAKWYVATTDDHVLCMVLLPVWIIMYNDTSDDVHVFF